MAPLYQICHTPAGALVAHVQIDRHRPFPLPKIECHSPVGFMPPDLALSILVHALHETMPAENVRAWNAWTHTSQAWRFYAVFLVEVLVPLIARDGTITEDEVRAWVKEARARRAKLAGGNAHS